MSPQSDAGTDTVYVGAVEKSYNEILDRLREGEVPVRELPECLLYLQLNLQEAEQRDLLVEIVKRYYLSEDFVGQSMATLFGLDLFDSQEIKAAIEFGKFCVCEGETSLFALPGILGMDIDEKMHRDAFGDILEAGLIYQLHQHENLLWFFDAVRPFSGTPVGDGSLSISKSNTYPFLKEMAHRFVLRMPYQFLRNVGRFSFENDREREEFFTPLFHDCLCAHPGITVYALNTPSIREIVSKLSVKGGIVEELRFFTGCEKFDPVELKALFLRLTLSQGISNETLVTVLSSDEGANALHALWKEENGKWGVGNFVSKLRSLAQTYLGNADFGDFSRSIFHEDFMEKTLHEDGSGLRDIIYEKAYDLFGEYAGSAKHAAFQALCLMPHHRPEHMEKKKGHVLSKSFSQIWEYSQAFREGFHGESLRNFAVLLAASGQGFSQDLWETLQFMIHDSGDNLWEKCRGEPYNLVNSDENLLFPFLYRPLKECGVQLSREFLAAVSPLASDLMNLVSYLQLHTCLTMEDIGASLRLLMGEEGKREEDVNFLIEFYMHLIYSLQIKAALCESSQEYRAFLDEHWDTKRLFHAAMRDLMDTMGITERWFSVIVFDKIQRKLLLKWKYPMNLLRLLKSKEGSDHEKENYKRWLAAVLELGKQGEESLEKLRYGESCESWEHLQHMPLDTLEFWAQKSSQKVSELSILAKNVRADLLIQGATLEESDDPEVFFTLADELGATLGKFHDKGIYYTLAGHSSSGKIKLITLRNASGELLAAAMLRLLMGKHKSFRDKPVLFIDQMLVSHAVRERGDFKEKRELLQKLLLAMAYTRSSKLRVRLFAHSSEYQAALKHGLLRMAASTFDLQSMGGATPEYLEILGKRFEETAEYSIPSHFVVEVKRR
ncbi:MAG: hypothetical protein ACI9S8_000548 [Chlamydiales bacterium]|jgi:hypothetical protein